MRYFSTFAFVSSLALLGAGCAPGNPGLVIDGVIAPPTSGGCTYDPSANVFLAEGVLDTTDLGTSVLPSGVIGPRYLAYLRASNHLINLFNGTYPLRADPNRMTLIAADVEITNIDGSITSFGALPNPFRVAASGVVPSAASDSPGTGIAGVELIPPQYATALGAVGGTVRLIVAVTLIGRTSGDAGVESNPFIFPIDVCTGCLVACTTDPMGTSIGCSPGQDAVTILPAGLPPC